MTMELLGRCSRSELEELSFSYWKIITILERLHGGVYAASNYKEYIITRQNYARVKELLNQLAD